MTYKFCVTAVPVGMPDHVMIDVYLDGKVVRCWEIPMDTATTLADALEGAVASIRGME